MRGEEWKDVVGYEGMYMISNQGRVKSYRQSKIGKFLSVGDNGSGYKNSKLTVNGKSSTYYIHRLIADAFLEKEIGKTYVDHIDGSKENNTKSNLRWCTGRENSRYHFEKQEDKTSKVVGVCFCKNKKVWIASIYKDGKRSTFRFGTEKLAIEAREFMEQNSHFEINSKYKNRKKQ